MSEKKQLSLYQKLHKIQSTVLGLSKNKKSFGYSYVNGDKVLSEIKPLMNELGLLLKQEVLSIDNNRQDYVTKNGSKSEIHSKVMMRFTWIDIETGDKDENLFGANGQNEWEKGLGSALTYGERYFLLKYFHIATDEDDIDNPERKNSNDHQLPKQPPTLVANKPKLPDTTFQNNVIVSKDIKALEASISYYDLTEDQSNQITVRIDNLKKGVE